jgi:hypothetical protein
MDQDHTPCLLAEPGCAAARQSRLHRALRSAASALRFTAASDRNRSRLTISADFTGHGIGMLLVPLMVRREARKEMPENMAALRRLIEESQRGRQSSGQGAPARPGHGMAARDLPCVPAVPVQAGSTRSHAPLPASHRPCRPLSPLKRLPEW